MAKCDVCDAKEICDKNNALYCIAFETLRDVNEFALQRYGKITEIIIETSTDNP